MSLTLSQIALPAITQMFGTLEHQTLRAEAFARDHELEESTLLGWRMAVDMFPLTFQYQIATEIPARGLSRLAGSEVPSFEDTETSFAELRERIERAREIIAALPRDAIDADPQADITVPAGPQELTFPRQVFLQQFVLANLYFHTTAAHVILRNIGLDLGKMDFLQPPQP